MRKRKAFTWAMFGVLAAFVVFTPRLRAASDEVSPSGVVGMNTAPELEEQPGPAATGLIPGAKGGGADIQPSDVSTVEVEPSGVIVGQALKEDKASALTPAATGVSP